MESKKSRSERFFQFHQRTMLVSFLFFVCLGALWLAAVLRPGPDKALGLYAPVLLTILVFTGSAVLRKRTLPGGRWSAADPDVQTVLQDEWMRTTENRATRVALGVVTFGQGPLMFLMAYGPPEGTGPETITFGMAAMTIALAGATRVGCYLYFSRQQDHE